MWIGCPWVERDPRAQAIWMTSAMTNSGCSVAIPSPDCMIGHVFLLRRDASHLYATVVDLSMLPDVEKTNGVKEHSSTSLTFCS